MDTWVELKKYLKNPITQVLLLISLWLFVSFMIKNNTFYVRMYNPLIAEATAAGTPLEEKRYNAAVDFVTAHKSDWVYLDQAGQERYQYEQFYMNQFDERYAYQLGMEAEKAAAESMGLRPGDIERFQQIEQRIKDNAVLRSYDSKGFLEIVMGKLWYADLLLLPLLFASIYAYDKYYISPLLAAAPKSATPYLRAKISASLVIGSALYWLPILTLLVYYSLQTNFLRELNLPYYFISFLSSWNLTIGQGLTWLVLSGFIQFIYLILILILISQSTRYILVAGVVGFLYSGGAVYGLGWLVQYFNTSRIIRWIVTIWALTPAGALSQVVRHDYFYPSNILGRLTFLKDYNLPLVTSTILMLPVITLLYRRRRTCFQDNGSHSQSFIFATGRGGRLFSDFCR